MNDDKIILSVPTAMKEQFKMVCEAKGQTMTSVAKMLIADYIKKEGK